MGRPKKDRPRGPYADIAERIIALRAVLDEGNAAAFCRRLNISPSRLSNLESSFFNLSNDVALRLVKAVPGLTLDWLYLGVTNGLSYDLARKLEAESKASTGRRNSVEDAAAGRAKKSTSSRAYSKTTKASSGSSGS